MKNTPVVKASPTEYSGAYRSEDGGYSLDLRVAADGSAQGSGQDMLNGSERAAFTLTNARVDGAVLSGTKAFADGRSEAFEAVFANRSVATGKNAKEIESRDTKHGLGFVQRNKDWTNRVFLEGSR